MTALGQRIRAYRAERALQQRQLAEKAGLSPSMLSQIESGRLTPSLLDGRMTLDIAAACSFLLTILVYFPELNRGIGDVGFVGASLCAERKRRQGI